jgi:hypothetical protein
MRIAINLTIFFPHNKQSKASTLCHEQYPTDLGALAKFCLYLSIHIPVIVLQIQIRDVHIRYEDDISLPGQVFAAGFTLKSLGRLYIKIYSVRSNLTSYLLD